MSLVLFNQMSQTLHSLQFIVYFSLQWYKTAKFDIWEAEVKVGDQGIFALSSNTSLLAFLLIIWLILSDFIQTYKNIRIRII